MCREYRCRPLAMRACRSRGLLCACASRRLLKSGSLRIAEDPGAAESRGARPLRNSSPCKKDIRGVRFGTYIGPHGFEQWNMFERKGQRMLRMRRLAASLEPFAMPFRNVVISVRTCRWTSTFHCNEQRPRSAICRTVTPRRRRLNILLQMASTILDQMSHNSP